MYSKLPSPKPRHPKMFMGSISTNLIHLRNPWAILWWSATFPGFGHILIGSYVKGFLLMVWEIIVNTQAGVNLGIFYSFTGRFALAKEVLDTRWVLLYIALYTYAMWDSYRSTVDLNKYSLLADREESPIASFNMDALEINYLDKRSPWIALVWSILMPGAGHLYMHCLPTGFIVLIWWIAITYFSRLLQALQFTAMGKFAAAVNIADPQWLLFLPSLYGFIIYDAYVNAVEYNRLFIMEQARFLKQNYQDPAFFMPENETAGKEEQ